MKRILALVNVKAKVRLSPHRTKYTLVATENGLHYMEGKLRIIASPLGLFRHDLHYPRAIAVLNPG